VAEKMKHDELVEIAARWLRKRFPVVCTEVRCGETPDAIGLGGAWSHLIECKTSRSDFLADQKKPWRRRDNALGCARSYLCPKGIIKPEDLPENWGLITVAEGKTREVVKPPRVRKCDMVHEYCILLSILRRVGQNPPRGVSVRCYSYETKNTTTVGVESATEEAIESFPTAYNMPMQCASPMPDGTAA